VERRVRVVLVTLDTLRYDQLVSADGTGPAMSRLAERAKRGLLFTRFYVPSAVTQPSHASMLTGLQPWEHGVTRNGMLLPERVPNLVERLQRAGWSTAAVVASFPVTKRFGFGRGFDTFREDFDRPFNKRMDTWESRWKLTGGEFFAIGGDVTDRAIEAIDGAGGSKQFFWVHYFDPHSPYGSSRGKGVLKGYINSLVGKGVEVESALVPVRVGYAVDVAYLDTELDRLLQHLDAAAQDFETHVLLVADHGESLGEAGYLGHGNRLTEELLRVPAVLLSPSVTPGRRDDVAAAIDVPRTLLALAGESVGEGELGGRDLATPPVAGGLAFGMRRSFSDGNASERYLDGSTRELEGHRYFQVGEQGRIVRGSGGGELLPADVTGLGASARGRIGSRFESFEARFGESKAVEDLDPETERALRELGYIE
jgi:choline-sulfatase